MKNNQQGYIIDKCKRIFEFQLGETGFTYCGTLNHEKIGQGKLMYYRGQCLYFNPIHQKIYAFSLEDKKQHWYYYQKRKHQTIIDVDVFGDQLMLLCRNAFNGHIYVYELNVTDMVLINRLRFLHHGPLYMSHYKEKLILYDNEYRVVLLLDQCCERDKTQIKYLIIPDEGITYYIQDEQLIGFNKYTQEIKAHDLGQYYIGINTVLI